MPCRSRTKRQSSDCSLVEPSIKARILEVERTRIGCTVAHGFWSAREDISPLLLGRSGVREDEEASVVIEE